MIALHRITDIKELLTFAPKLLELHAGLEGKWEPDLTAQEFFASLLRYFDEKAYYFGAMRGDELLYFSVLLRETDKKALFWLFYMNPTLRLETKNTLNELKKFMQKEGFSTVYTQSTRTSSSYERWLEKFGAKKVAIIYKFTI